MSTRSKTSFAIVLSISTVVLLTFPPFTSHAQEQTSTETPTSGVTETPVSTETQEVTATATIVETETQVLPSPEEKLTERLLIKASRKSRLAALMMRMNVYGQVVESDELGVLGIFILNVPADQIDTRISEMSSESGVAWVEPDYPVQALETIPNDPSFPDQYALTAIRAPQGWDISTGSSSITIAVLDSGADMNHPELAGRIIQGFDFVNNDNLPQDDYGHGTHVAGIAAASANNGIGIAGVSWGAMIMPVKVLNSSGGGRFSDVAAGIVWATDHGAQIINMSLGGSNFSQTLEDAVNYSTARGTLLLAASGNSNTNMVLYPARFPQVMAVAATDASNQRASFSNYGPEVEIAAPGAGILSLWTGGGYNTISGTSMATPYVSGLAAILFGYANNASVVRDQLKQSALDVAPAGFDIYTGAGLIQMDAALRLAIPPTATSTVSALNPVANVPPRLSLPTLVWTQTPLATFTVVPVMSITASPSIVPTLPLPIASTATVSTSVPDVEAQGKDYDFTSPLFCGGILLILLGAAILLLFPRRRRKR